MGIVHQEAIKQLQSLIEKVDEPKQETFKIMHQGYPTQTLVRFLNAREWNVGMAYKMLVDCLEWRIQNEIDSVLSRPIIPTELYRSIRESQLVGLAGYSKEGLPVIATGVGLSAYNKASVDHYVQSHIQLNEYRDRVILPYTTKKHGRYISTCIKVMDMTGLKLSALNQTKLLTIIATIDERNYPEKTEAYYVVNAPRIFSACWKVVKPLLQERTKKKVQVLQGCGRDELLKVMDYASLPHFCRKEVPCSSKHSGHGAADNCFALDHDFHQQLYNYIKDRAKLMKSISPISQGYFHVDIPISDPEDSEIAKTIVSEIQRLGDQNEISNAANSKTWGTK